jgi:hypothetical protein
MSEWWTYTLSDFLLFSPRTYYRLFELYNAAIWPAHVLALALGVAILALIHRGGAGTTRWVLTILAGCWIFVGWAFLWNRYATINWAAAYVAVGFGLEALILLWAAWRWRLSVRPRTYLGLGVIVFALLVQPLIGPLLGRNWLQIELFGVSPDPTAVATLGVLALIGGRIAWAPWIIPLIWCALTGVTLWTMEAPDAVLTPIAALIALAAAWQARRSIDR